ncbi:MAG TPA: M48 family metallopeptidase [Rhizomicrobium sp.]|jgi:Zn-dependent protease with chaperone function
MLLIGRHVSGFENLKHRAGLIVLLLAIPTFGSITGETLSLQAISNFAALQRPGVLPLDFGCAQASYRALAPNACTHFENLITLRDVSVLCGFFLIGLVAAIALAARYVRGRRDRLISIFGPGARGLIALLPVITLICGAIAVYSLFELRSTVLGGIAFDLSISFGVVSATNAIALAVIALIVLRIPVLHVESVEFGRTDQPALWEVVTRLASRLGATPPDHIIAGLDYAFFVVASPLKLFKDGGALNGEILYLSLPLLRVLTQSQLEAIIAHELFHFKGGDARWAIRFAPIYARAMMIHGSPGSPPSSRIARTMLPALVLFSFFVDLFTRSAHEMSRARELQADEAGAELVGATAIGGALTKLTALRPIWSDMRNAFANRKIDGANLSALFAHNVKRNLENEVWRRNIVSWAASKRMAHPVDTHPTLRERVAALGLNVEDLEGFLSMPEQPSIELIQNAKVIEMPLSDKEKTILRHVASIPLRSRDKVDSELRHGF